MAPDSGFGVRHASLWGRECALWRWSGVDRAGAPEYEAHPLGTPIVGPLTDPCANAAVPLVERMSFTYISQLWPVTLARGLSVGAGTSLGGFGQSLHFETEHCRCNNCSCCEGLLTGLVTTLRCRDMPVVRQERLI